MSEIAGDGPDAPLMHVGPWRIEFSAAGTGLRRDPAAYERLGDGLQDWASTDVVPPADEARRVVVVGESTARGWPTEQLLSPTSVLQRHLDLAGAYQCVDLAKVGANSEDLNTVARSLPALEPSVIVSFAGNNWMLSPPADDAGRMHPDAGAGLSRRLADGLRSGGWAGMRSQFVAHVLPDVLEYMALLADARRRSGSSVVVVIPEYDLQGFAPPADVEMPALDPSTTARWYALRAQAQHLMAAGRPEGVAAIAREMAALDGGCSPVPGWLAGQAAISLGDGPGAREALEDSRDSVVGMMVRHTPRVTEAVRTALLSAAAEHGFHVVEMRTILADRQLPELPDPDHFLDYCHLSDSGIEAVAAAIADAVLDQPVGTTAAGRGLTDQQRAFASARVAAQLAFQSQPDATVIKHLAVAATSDPAVAHLLRHVRDLLEAPSPAWLHPTTAIVSEIEAVLPFLPSLVGPAAQWPELWTLLRCLDAALEDGHRSPHVDDGAVDVLALQAPEGHVQANWTPAHAHLVSSASVSSLHLGVAGVRQPVGIRLEYRTPLAGQGSTVEVKWETELLATMPASTSWTRRWFELPAHVFERKRPVLRVHWPVPRPDAGLALGEDAAALDRGEFPAVFPVHGEIYEATLVPVVAQPSDRLA